MELTIVTSRHDGPRAVLTLSGRLHATTAPELKTQLKQLVEDGQIHLIIDLAGVTFIDSSGLSALVSGLKAARQAEGSFCLAAVNDQARTAFRLTMLDRVFTFYPDAEAALQALQA